MTFLLISTAFMLAASGVLKIRSTTRVGLGVAPAALLELLFAVGVSVVALPGVGAGSTLSRWVVPVAILVLIGSSVNHAMRLGAYRRQREESEGGRLASYVKYRSSVEGPTGGDTGGGGDVGGGRDNGEGGANGGGGDA